MSDCLAYSHQRPQQSPVCPQFPSSHRVGDGSRGLGAGTQLYVTISLPLSRLLREQMGNLELGDPRDTLEPKAMKEQEDSMGPQDPSVYR